MKDLVIALIALAGAFFMLVAAIGLIRMPDLFLRMSAMAKAGTLGAGLMLLATIFHFGSFTITSRAVATIIFFLLTAPVAAHMIARAAYFDGVPLWKGTRQDDLQGHYHKSNHVLDSKPILTEDTVIPTVEGDQYPEAG